ncbi:DUF5606 domain-containing protein [Capnocytophaga gingivalis]|uniref:DUF5606 family protein n=1 Tax=Capnocytophaga gingivalis TaxID=1017 RepID=UPI0028D7C53C|nr:DUF5606 domain-containing protein [Capnocytophaga gingivalis]
MKLNQILTISGKPGLYQLQSRTRSGFLALSLLDQKRISIGLRNNVSLLSEIAIYTLEGEKPLEEVFKAIKEKENGQKTTVSHKATEDELEAYFFSVIPNYDEDKVYPSDIKKIIQWYNILIDKGFLEEEAPVALQEAEA